MNPVLRKTIGISTAVLVVAIAAFLFFKFWFVYSEGVNTGDLNYFQKEGFMFKTYEGKIIQTGYNSHKASNTIQSNELKFSVDNQAVADSLLRCSGKQVELHWRRYLGILPWRGNSQYVVDEVLSVKQQSSVSLP